MPALQSDLGGEGFGGGGEGAGAAGGERGKFEAEAGAAADGAIDFDDAVVFVDDAVADGEAEAGAFFGAFGGEEGVVDASQVFGGNSLTCVGDFENSAARCSVGTDG